MYSDNKVITRIAPSPTGTMHVGTARTALFNFLYARKKGGEFILRIEDTDKERSKKEYEDEIFESLRWLGLSPDDWYRQSDRMEIYKDYLQKIVNSGHAYVSKEESKNDPGREVEVVRLKNPGKSVIFEDVIRGEVEFNVEELGDIVIAKSIEEPLYHFAVVVDDNEMGVTDVIRGDDHISNTPRQILIQEALGFKRPLYAHLPMILAEDKSKLSKRKGQVSIIKYIEQGYLPEAMINFLALLGWNPGDDREFFSKDELVEKFSLEKIQKNGAVFNIQKLNWFNKEYLKKMSEKDFVDAIEKYLPEESKYNRGMLENISSIIMERTSIFCEVEDVLKDLSFFFERVDYTVNNLKWKDTDLTTTKKYLEDLIKMLDSISEDNFDAVSIKDKVWDYASEKGRGQVLWPFRYALSGRDKSPDPFVIAGILGKQETIERLRLAINKISS